VPAAVPAAAMATALGPAAHGPAPAGWARAAWEPVAYGCAGSLGCGEAAAAAHACAEGPAPQLGQQPRGTGSVLLDPRRPEPSHLDAPCAHGDARGLVRGLEDERTPAEPLLASVDAESVVSATASPSTGQTTLMLKQLPQHYGREMLAELLDSMGFAGLYDFIYMPMNLLTKSSFTYAFVNMISPEAADGCRQKLDGFSQWQLPSPKACVALWAVQQGLYANIERYRNSPVMHPSVPSDFKPALYKDGVHIAFPPPTRELKAPKARRVRK